MSWASIVIVFVSLFTVFTSFNPSIEVKRPVGAVKTYSKGAVAANQAQSQSDYENKVQKESVVLPSNIDYSSNSSLSYQTIVSYIMDYNKTVPLSEVIAISEAAVEYGAENSVDPLLLAAQMSAESSFNRKAVSSSGAKGLGQLMPFNFEKYNISDPFDIQQGSRAQATMMKDLLDMWDGNVNYALASYYEGHNAIKSKKGTAFKPDTQKYVDKIIGRYNKLKNYK